MATDYNQLLANPEASAFASQRKLAEMLLKQGSQTPQGQMIGNIYVGASPWQMLGNLAQQYSGQLNLEDVDKKELAMAKALREQDMADLQAGMQLYQGTPAKTTELAGPYGQGVGAEGANVAMPVAVTSEQAPNTQLAMAKLLGSTGPKSSAMGGELMKQMFKEPNWEKTSIKQNGQEIFGVYDKRNPDVLATFRPYNVTADIPTLNAQYSGVLPGGMTGTTPGASTGTATTPVSVRNNNPGNIVGPDGKFLSFPTPEAGDAALRNDLSLKLSGQSPAYKAKFGNTPVTPLTLAETWSPASAKGNSPESTANYSKFIADKLGIAPNQPIPNTPQALQAVKSAITQFEAGAYDGQTPKAKIEASKYDLQPPSNFQSRKEQDEWFAKAREPLTGEMAKKASGAVTTLRALDEYKALVDNYSKSQFLSPDDRAILTKAHAQLMLQLKDANGLGVLNKGDLPMLEKLIVNPNNIGSLILSKSVLENQVTEQKAFMRDVIKNTYLDNGKQIPESVKQKLVALDQELEASKAAKTAKPSKTSATTGAGWGQATVVTK
jgi:hypothetical protein